MSLLVLTLAMAVSSGASPDGSFSASTKASAKASTKASTTVSAKASATTTAKERSRKATEQTRRKQKRSKSKRAKRRARSDLASVLKLTEAPGSSQTRALPTAPTLGLSTSSTAAGAKSPTARPMLVASSGISLATLFWPGLLLVLGALALAFFKRREHNAQTLQILERISVGRGRDLLVVEVAGSRMLLGATDGGIAVLDNALPRSDFNHDQYNSRHQSDAASAPEGGLAAALSTTFKKMLWWRRSWEEQAQSFESHIEQNHMSTEQEELRRKIKDRLNSTTSTERETTNPGFSMKKPSRSARSQTVRA